MQACDYCCDPAVWRVMGALGGHFDTQYNPPHIMCEKCFADLSRDRAKDLQHLDYEPLILDKPGGES